MRLVESKQNHTNKEELQWQAICDLDALIANAGVCALLANNRQVAIFYLPMLTPSIYAIENYDPIGQANVLYRGIVGSTVLNIDDKELVVQEPFVSSPLYKQQFSLVSGRCLQQESVQLQTFDVRVRDNMVQLLLTPEEMTWKKHA